MSEPNLHRQRSLGLECIRTSWRISANCGFSADPHAGVWLDPPPRRVFPEWMEGIDPEQLARALIGLDAWARENAPSRESPVGKRMREHFGAEPSGFPVVSAPVRGFERVNFQVALDALLAEDGWSGELIGLSTMHGYRMGLAELVQSTDEEYGTHSLEPGPTEYETEEVGERTITCVAAGLWLVVSEDDGPLALMLTREDHGPSEASLGLEAMAPDRTGAEKLLARLRELMDQHNVYRG